MACEHQGAKRKDGWGLLAREEVLEKYPANMSESKVDKMASWEVLSIAMSVEPIPVKDMDGSEDCSGK